MELIDDDGNLFGVVNVIDALAVLLVLAVVVAGIAVVGVLDSGEPDTRYATVDLGAQPAYVIDSVDPGDIMSINGQNLTVTDTYATPASTEETEDEEVSGDTALHVRVEVEGQRVEDEFGEPRFEFGGSPFRTGDQITLESNDYVVDGAVTSIEQEGTELDVTTTSVLVESIVSESVADEITEGDTFKQGPYTMATVRNVQPYPIADGRYRVQVGVDLETMQTGSTRRFADRPVTVGSELNMVLDSYALDGEILSRGTTTPAGEATSTTAEIKLDNIDPDVADGLSAGLTETERGETLATIQAVTTQSAEVVLESEEGNIYLREHPTNKDVRLTVELQTLTTGSELRFHGEKLNEGDGIRLDFGRIAVEGTVARLN